jgi:hypothetical protein
MKKGYSSELQRKRSANSPWRNRPMVLTAKAFAIQKKLKESNAAPRKDLD